MDEREIESFIDKHFEGLSTLKGEGSAQYSTKTVDFGIRVTYKGKPVTIWKKDADDDSCATAKRKLDRLTSN